MHLKVPEVRDAGTWMYRRGNYLAWMRLIAGPVTHMQFICTFLVRPERGYHEKKSIRPGSPRNNREPAIASSKSYRSCALSVFESSGISGKKKKVHQIRCTLKSITITAVWQASHTHVRLLDHILGIRLGHILTGDLSELLL